MLSTGLGNPTLGGVAAYGIAHARKEGLDSGLYSRV